MYTIFNPPLQFNIIVPTMTTILLAAVLLLVFPAKAELDDSLKMANWDEIIFDGKKTNKFTAINTEDKGIDGIQFLSENAVSIAFFNVNNDLNKMPKLQWQWRVDTPIIDTDLTRKGGDDRSMVVYIAFPYQSEHASFGQKLKRTTIELLKGKDTPGRVISYVWGGGEKGAMTENPYTGEYGVYVFLRNSSDPSGQWLDERIDLRADFIKAFGYEPESPMYIGVGGDSDDTKTRIDASLRQITFTD